MRTSNRFGKTSDTTSVNVSTIPKKDSSAPKKQDDFSNTYTPTDCILSSTLFP